MSYYLDENATAEQESMRRTIATQAAQIEALTKAIEEIVSKDRTGYGQPALGRIARKALDGLSTSTGK